jgi:hypothetical protein
MPEYYKKIEHWFDYQNLYDDLLKNRLPDNSTFIEVGVWKGASLVYLAELSKELNKKIHIIGVDIFSSKLDDINDTYKVERNKIRDNNYLIFLYHLQQVKCLHFVTPVALFSEDASLLFEDRTIDCVFLDGSHDEASVKKDLDCWLPKIKPEGYICGHDYAGGIKPIIDEYFLNSFNGKVTEYPPHSFIAQLKPKPLN